MAEKYTLNWDTFSEHLQLMFKDLYQEGRYTDVTLVSDDQTQFKAHKIVLSACVIIKLHYGLILRDTYQLSIATQY